MQSQHHEKGPTPNTEFLKKMTRMTEYVKLCSWGTGDDISAHVCLYCPSSSLGCAFSTNPHDQASSVSV